MCCACVGSCVCVCAGKFPGVAVRTVNQICRTAEKNFDFEAHFEYLMTNALEDEEEKRFIAETVRNRHCTLRALAPKVTLQAGEDVQSPWLCTC